MTKLKKEQIEQERVKFEEWFNKERKDNINKYWDEKLGEYIFSPMDLGFRAWLARAELDKGE